MPPGRARQGRAWIVKPAAMATTSVAGNAPARGVAWRPGITLRGGDGVQVGFPLRRGRQRPVARRRHRRRPRNSTTAARRPGDPPCPSFNTQPGQTVASARSKTLPLRKKRRAVAPAGQRAVRSSPIRAAPAPSEPRFYRYPTMYRAEAPPLLPPGARGFAPFVQRPHVLVSGGIWYWPGALEFRMPQVTGFEPVIDPSGSSVGNLPPPDRLPPDAFPGRQRRLVGGATPTRRWHTRAKW